MKKVLKLMVFVLFIPTVAFAFLTEFHSDNDYINALSSTDLNDRVSALEDLNKKISANNMVLSSRLKEKCYRIIDEVMTGRKTFEKQDEEMNYRSNVFALAININDENTFPYLVQYTELGGRVNFALLKHGSRTVHASLDLVNNFEKLSLGRKCGLLQLFSELIKEKEKSYTATAAERGEIKNAILKIIETTKYPERSKFKDELEYENDVADIMKYVKQPELDFLLILGDKDVIPIIEKIALEDEGCELYSRNSFDKSKKEGKQLRHKKKINAQYGNTEASLEGKAQVKYYRIREYATKVLKELKKKNGM